MTQRYDVLVVPEDVGRRIAPRGADAYIRHFAVSRAGIPNAEAVAEEWVEVYCKPGPSAHEPFVKGVYDGEHPVFLEAAIRFGTRGVPMPYGIEDTEIFFFLEFRGCLFKDPGGKFKNKFKDILAVRPAIFHREHTALPPHLEVPDDEQPKDKRKKKKAGPGQAGTSTEEW